MNRENPSKSPNTSEKDLSREEFYDKIVYDISVLLKRVQREIDVVERDCVLDALLDDIEDMRR